MKNQLNKKIVLLNISIETPDHLLRSEGYEVVGRSLHSKPQNWRRIKNFLGKLNNKTDFVLAKFTEYTLFLSSHPDYAKAFDGLITQLRQMKHVVYIYEANLSGEFSCETSVRTPHRWPQKDFDDEDEIQKDDSHKLFENSGEIGLEEIDYYSNDTVLNDIPESKEPANETYLHYWCCGFNIDDASTALHGMTTAVRRIATNLTVLPYRTLADISLGASSYIESCIRGLLLRIYVPKEKIWSSEVARLVQLFQEYASSVRGQDVQLVEEHTEIGNIYSFFSKNNEIISTDIASLFDEFNAFLDICVRDPKKAHSLLRDTTISPERAAQIISKYSKEARRLALDIRQEAELKLLTIRHQLEAELSDITIAEDITKQLASAINPESLTSNLLSAALKPDNMQLTINQNYIGTVNGIVSSQILGRIAYNEYDDHLLSLINQYSKSETEKKVLQSALSELKDEGVKKPDRTGAWQKLRGFLAVVADKVGDVGVVLLAKYLESYVPKP